MLTQERLKELLRYRKSTGVWTWKTVKGRTKGKESVAGCVTKSGGYRYIGVDGKLFQSSRLAFLYVLGYFPEHDVDHRNKIRHDDKWNNLRHATRSCNLKNCKAHKDNISGVKGVSLNKKTSKWEVKIRLNGKTKYLGLYEDFIEAVAIRFTVEQCSDWLDCDLNSSSGNALKEYLKAER